MAEKKIATLTFTWDKSATTQCIKTVVAIDRKGNIKSGASKLGEKECTFEFDNAVNNNGGPDTQIHLRAFNQITSLCFDPPLPYRPGEYFHIENKKKATRTLTPSVGIGNGGWMPLFFEIANANACADALMGKDSVESRNHTEVIIEC